MKGFEEASDGNKRYCVTKSATFRSTENIRNRLVEDGRGQNAEKIEDAVFARVWEGL
jgi:hypothetical protein